MGEMSSVAALESVVGPRMPADVANELRSVLASLRLAYSGGGPLPPPPPPQSERPPIWTPKGNV